MSYQLYYQGWSGWVVDPASEEGLAPLLFDPSPAQELEDRETVVLITHGHPEHVQGILRHLARPRRHAVTVIASASVCAYLSRRASSSLDGFQPVQPGDRFEVGGWSVRVFEWDHMSLLPPGLGRKAGYLCKLARHPLRLARIALDGIGGPLHGPMMGYQVESLRGGTPLVYLGEGLHRRTTEERLDAALDGNRPVALIAGVEPEDTREIPQLLKTRRLHSFCAFEPHQDWRTRFGMPQLDMRAFLKLLDAEQLQTHAPRPGETVCVCWGGGGGGRSGP